jgi:signal transduction histidine kinase
LPVWLLSDPSRLRQVLLNLLGNAVKFTSGGNSHAARVMLFVEPCTLPQGQPGFQVRVSDSGIGMSAETPQKLFQPFTQADESTSRKFGGSGLGLSICKRLIELMGGHISLTNLTWWPCVSTWTSCHRQRR